MTHHLMIRTIYQASAVSPDMVLKVFSEVGCSGDTKDFKDSEVNLQKVGIKFAIKSVIVIGNPWVLYADERFQGFLAYLEEGQYDDLSTLGVCPDVKITSIKFKKEKLADPHIALFNNARFEDDCNLAAGQAENWWSAQDVKFKSISVGAAGVWAIKSDFTVMFREGTGHSGNNDTGSGWAAVIGKMKQLDVGLNVVWATNSASEVFVRIGLCPDDPKGKEWTKIDGNMKQISVGPNSITWAVDKASTVWRRQGAKASNPIGTKWQSVTGKLQHISVGPSGIWGITPKNEVMYRDSTFGLPGECESGNGWTKVDGLMSWVSSGDNMVWGVTPNGDLWYRNGVDASNPMGLNWFKVSTLRDKSIEFTQAKSHDGVLWGVDKQDITWCKTNANITNMIPGTSVNIYEDSGNFKSTALQERPGSYMVCNGGWVLYTLPNFKGKAMFDFDGDCFSNDPPNPKGPKLKSWQDPIGSVRPIRGGDCRVATLAVVMDWTKVSTEHEEEIIACHSHSNNSFEYAKPEYNSIMHVNSTVTHRFILSEETEVCKGCSFTVEGVPKQGISFADNGEKLETGTNFRQELNSTFVFHTAKEAERNRIRTEIVKLPPRVPPKTTVKNSVLVHKGTIKIPFVANFTSGIKAWSVNGMYIGEDLTNIRIEFEESCLLEANRKISRMQ